MEIIIPILICFAIAVVCAAVLTLTSHFFAVKEDETFSRLRDCMAGANCGACGFSGCDGYASALADGSCDKTNLCTPGGETVAVQLAEILGVEAEQVEKRVAHVECNGKCGVVAKRYDYQGHGNCKIANMNYAGDKLCTFACLGYGDCAAACPQNAISVVEGVAVVDKEKCIGCELCLKTCPKGMISMIRYEEKVAVACSNHDKGAAVRKYCANGCIACGLCKKNCPSDAITITDNIAVIDYEKCSRCGKCVSVCPVGCIKEK